jgi:putative hemolysin
MFETPGQVMPGLSSVFEGLRGGPLEVRLARDRHEVEAAQRLRYVVFYDEMGAAPTPQMRAESRDFDRYDAFCDHLLVIHHGDGDHDKPRVIGTYRLLRRSVAERFDGFYTASEFDIAPLLGVPGELLELGRACVDAEFRSRPTMQLLWRGIASYVNHYGVKLMFGCASLPGTDPTALARTLSYLHYNHLAPEPIRARALPERYVATNILPASQVDATAAVADLDARATLSALPPLIKGYLRLGGMIGDGAVVDPVFKTTDVCIIVVTDLLAEKYFNHYLRNGT